MASVIPLIIFLLKIPFCFLPHNKRTVTVNTDGKALVIDLIAPEKSCWFLALFSSFHFHSFSILRCLIIAEECTHEAYFYPWFSPKAAVAEAEIKTTSNS